MNMINVYCENCKILLTEKDFSIFRSDLIKNGYTIKQAADYTPCMCANCDSCKNQEQSYWGSFDE